MKHSLKTGSPWLRDSVVKKKIESGSDSLKGALNPVWSRVSGPAPVSFANPNATHTLVRFSSNGIYLLRLTANDGQLTAADDVTVIVAPAGGAPTNFAPVVSAGTNQIVRFSEPVVLHGAASDDGQPNPPGQLSNVWSKVSGLGTVAFADGQAVNTPVTFSDPGLYGLRLTSDDGEVKTADEVTINALPTPVVNIQAAQTNAAEFGLVPGAFRVTRNGDTSLPLTVHLATSGTASNGVDYAALTNVVSFAPGLGTTTLAVQPLADDLPEGDETVVFSVRPDLGYAVGSNGVATITIRDLPWDAWRLANFSGVELQNTNLTGELGDVETDLLVNLLEYAFHRDPHTADHTNYFSGAFETLQGPVGGGTGYVVTFKRRQAPTDLTYEVQVTADFVTWLSGASVARQSKVTDDGNGVTETVKFQILGTAPRFVRLRVSRTTGHTGGNGTTP